MPIKLWKEDTGKSVLFKWEKGLFEVVKVRNDFHCYGCDKNVKKGCYAIGDTYYKVCLNCADMFIDNFLKSLKDHKKKANLLKKDLEENKGKYLKNNVINSV